MGGVGSNSPLPQNKPLKCPLSSITKQLQNFCGFVRLCCNIFMLWVFIFDLVFGMQK